MTTRPMTTRSIDDEARLDARTSPSRAGRSTRSRQPLLPRPVPAAGAAATGRRGKKGARARSGEGRPADRRPGGRPRQRSGIGHLRDRRRGRIRRDPAVRDARRTSPASSTDVLATPRALGHRDAGPSATPRPVREPRRLAVGRASASPSAGASASPSAGASASPSRQREPGAEPRGEPVAQLRHPPRWTTPGQRASEARDRMVAEQFARPRHRRSPRP